MLPPADAGDAGIANHMDCEPDSRHSADQDPDSEVLDASVAWWGGFRTVETCDN